MRYRAQSWGHRGQRTEAIEFGIGNAEGGKLKDATIKPPWKYARDWSQGEYFIFSFLNSPAAGAESRTICLPYCRMVYLHGNYLEIRQRQYLGLCFLHHRHVSAWRGYTAIESLEFAWIPLLEEIVFISKPNSDKNSSTSLALPLNWVTALHRPPMEPPSLRPFPKRYEFIRIMD
jgi:hypothetical protein